jgi:hypothetical protein
MKLREFISELEKVRSQLGDNVDVTITGAYGSYTGFIKKIHNRKLRQEDHEELCVIETDLMSG